MQELEKLSPLIFYAAFILTLMNLTLLKADLTLLREFLASPYGLTVTVPLATGLTVCGLVLDPRGNAILSTAKCGMIILGVLFGFTTISLFVGRLVDLVVKFVTLVSIAILSKSFRQAMRYATSSEQK